MLWLIQDLQNTAYWTSGIIVTAYWIPVSLLLQLALEVITWIDSDSNNDSDSDSDVNEYSNEKNNFIEYYKP